MTDDVLNLDNIQNDILSFSVKAVLGSFSLTERAERQLQTHLIEIKIVLSLSMTFYSLISFRNFV